MSRLAQNSTPAERKRGCMFAETFRDAASVIANGGSITETPTVDGGAVIDCSNGEVITNNSELNVGLTSWSRSSGDDRPVVRFGTNTVGGSTVIPASIDFDGIEFALGMLTNVGRYWEGDILAGAVWRKALTPLQVKDLSLRLLKQVNDK